MIKRKLALVIPVFAAFALYGCSDDAENTSKDKATVQSEDTSTETTNEVTKQKVKVTKENEKTIIDDNIGFDDELIDYKRTENEIKATVKVVGGNGLSTQDVAESRYSSISDALLQKDGWDTLTIKFEDVGTVSFNRDQAEENEIGLPYFPIAEIMKQLK
ncbi:hypothetical protein [Viridibacillus sp. FSL R5-0888]|uniref:hypothetical protein n=1 Tax=Viridibacillus sp. FSL R5-0888 TaxID=2921663 RepID=UPI0030F953B1